VRGSQHLMMGSYSLAMFRALLWLYPGEFRDEYGREMALVFANRYRNAANGWERVLLWAEAVAGVIFHAPKEHFYLILRDFQYALRLLWKSPVFAVTAILSLAFGIGANTAIFAVAKRVLIDTLPVERPHELRMLAWVSGHEPPTASVWGDISPTKEGGQISTCFSYPVLQELRKRTDVFADLIAFKDAEMTATINGHAEMITVEMLDGNAFHGLGLRPVLGRALTATDDAGRGTTPAAVIGDRYWASKFDRSASVLGKTISVNGATVVIVGVAPAQFTGLTTGAESQVFVPLTLQPLLLPRAQGGSGSTSLIANPQAWWIQVLVRLRHNVPETSTQAALDVVMRRTTRATLAGAKNLHQLHLKLEPGDRGLDYLDAFEKPSYVLLALAGLVLLLSCVNVANLLLARSLARGREISTRLALGASRTSIFQQLLIESVVLSAIGGMAGLSLAYFGRNVIPRLLADSGRVTPTSIDFDWRVAVFALATSLLTTLLFGALPAWRTMRTDVNAALKDVGRATMGSRRVSLGKGLVALQVALSTVLVLGSGLFVRTLINLSERALGFRTDHILLFRVNPPRTRYSDAAKLSLYRHLESELAGIPGVQSIALSNIGLIGDGHSGSTFHVSGRSKKKDEDRVQTNSVSVNFFRTMGIGILQGRDFNVHDETNSVKVAIVNRALVRRYFPNENPIGQTFESEDSTEPIQIIGITSDTRYGDLRSETPPIFYVPYLQAEVPLRMIVQIRSKAEPHTVLPQVRAMAESLDRNLPLVDVRTEEQQIETTLSTERIFAQLTTGFGIMALALASMGIYGLMAYAVTRQRTEIGIRMALGARVEQILARVLRDALSIAMAGLGIGMLFSLWLGQFISPMLYNLKAFDPAVIALTILLLLIVTLAAGIGPARRASRIDPLVSLKHE
jgi:predicted permease